MAQEPLPEGGAAPLIVTASVMARVVGLTERRLDQLAHEGMPKAGRQGYPLAGAVQWIINYWRTRATQSPLNIARQRKVEADATVAEIELALLQGDTVRVSTHARALGLECSRLRTRLLAIPSKMAPHVKRAKTITEIEAALRREISEALEELSGGGKAKA